MFNRELYDRIKEHEETIKRLRAALEASNDTGTNAWQKVGELRGENAKLQADNNKLRASNAALLKELANGPRVIDADHARSDDDDTIIAAWKPSPAKPAPSRWQRFKAALARLVDIDVGIGFYPSSAPYPRKAQAEYEEAVARRNAEAAGRSYSDLMARAMARDADELRDQLRSTTAKAFERRDRGEDYLK